jgi:hypothetical protein
MIMYILIRLIIISIGLIGTYVIFPNKIQFKFKRARRGFDLVVRAAGWHASDPGSILGRDGIHLYIWMYTPSVVSTFGWICALYKSSYFISFQIQFSLKLTLYFNAVFLKDCHPHPGTFYEAINRSAYLPDTPEGRTVLMLLKTAFDRRLVFTIAPIAQSSSSYGHSHGQAGSVVEGITWNDITHKTSMASRRYPVWFLL